MYISMLLFIPQLYNLKDIRAQEQYLAEKTKHHNIVIKLFFFLQIYFIPTAEFYFVLSFL